MPEADPWKAPAYSAWWRQRESEHSERGIAVGSITNQGTGKVTQEGTQCGRLVHADQASLAECLATPCKAERSKATSKLQWKIKTAELTLGNCQYVLL